VGSPPALDRRRIAATNLRTRYLAFSLARLEGSGGQLPLSSRPMSLTVISDGLGQIAGSAGLSNAWQRNHFEVCLSLLKVPVMGLEGLHAEAAMGFVHGGGGQFFLSKTPA